MNQTLIYWRRWIIITCTKNIVNGAMFDYNEVCRKISAVFKDHLMRVDMYLDHRG